MGCITSGPCSCLSACGGTLLGKFAIVGSTDSDFSAKCLLVWLQVFAALAAIFAQKYAESMVHHAAYRVEAAAAVTFLLLAALSVCGCTGCAARRFPLGKFVILAVLAMAFTVVPDKEFKEFGRISSSLSCLFLAAQAVILIDRSTAINDHLFLIADTANMRDDKETYNTYTNRILTTCLFMFLATVASAIYLSTVYPAALCWVVVAATCSSFGLLFLSITEWSEHGNLLCSCTMWLYSMWLSYEALFCRPEPSVQPGLSPWPGLALMAVSLRFMLDINEDFRGALEAKPLRAVEAGEMQSLSKRRGIDSTSFAGHCLVHALAALYVASELNPVQTEVAFHCRVAALAASQTMWAWFLVAPYVLTSRPV